MKQSDFRFGFQALAGRTEFEVVSFKLEEAISQPFVLSLELVSYDSDVDFGQVLDKPALSPFIAQAGHCVMCMAWSVPSAKVKPASVARATTLWSSRSWPAPACVRTGESSSRKPYLRFLN